MKTLVVAASAYGNTWSLAEAIAGVIPGAGSPLRPVDATTSDVKGLDLLVVGSPTQGGRPLPEVSTFLKRLPRETVARLAYASFDTRIEVRERGFGLKALAAVIGYAAPKIARELSGRGAYQLVPPEGFIVEDREGPLREGELERATQWARWVDTLASQRRA